jgi:hypothetical protein
LDRTIGSLSGSPLKQRTDSKRYALVRAFSTAASLARSDGMGISPAGRGDIKNLRIEAKEAAPNGASLR